MLFVGGPLSERGPLHVLVGGGGMVAGGADHDEDLPLFEEGLVPPLHLGLPQGRSRLNAKERDTKMERWQSDFDLSDGGRMWGVVEVSVWAS